MKVVCMDDYYISLRIGKTYTVIKEDLNGYAIINDYNVDCWYNKKFFKSLSEIRNEKIDKLLEE